MQFKILSLTFSNDMVKVPYLNLKATLNKDKLRQAIDEVIDSGWFILGKNVQEFEQQFAQFCQSQYCIGVGNGLDALRLLLIAHNIQAGDEVIVQGNTYIATILAMTQIGAIPVLVEPSLETFNLNPAQVIKAITQKTKAIMAVHLYGNPAPMLELKKIAQAHHLYLFDDCAQAHGAKINGQNVGNFGDGSAFSFFPTKNLGCLGDGGGVTTSNPEISEKISWLRNYGSHQKYYNNVQGWNSRLDEIQAAILLQKLSTLEAENQERRKLAQRYIQGLEDLPIFQLNYNPNSAYHIFPILIEKRDKLQQFLIKQGIQTLIHYPLPPHQQKCYRDESWAKCSLPITEKIAQQELSLPLYVGLSESNQNYIIEKIHDFYA